MCLDLGRVNIHRMAATLPDLTDPAKAVPGPTDKIGDEPGVQIRRVPLG